MRAFLRVYAFVPVAAGERLCPGGGGREASRRRAPGDQAVVDLGVGKEGALPLVSEALVYRVLDASGDLPNIGGHGDRLLAD